MASTSAIFLFLIDSGVFEPEAGLVKASALKRKIIDTFGTPTYVTMVNGKEAGSCWVGKGRSNLEFESDAPLSDYIIFDTNHYGRFCEGYFEKKKR